MMKRLPPKSESIKKSVIFLRFSISFTLLVFLLCLFDNLKSENANHIFHTLVESSECDYFAAPDTSEIDTSENTSIYYDGDTIDMYVIGADTIYTIYQDTSSADSNNLSLRETGDALKIILSNQTFNVQEGLLGINITDLFEPGHANEYDDLSKYPPGQNPWDYISALCPKTLRIFSGQGSRFMELLGSKRTAANDPFNVSGNMMNGGYGFCMERIIPFFDNTAGLSNDAPPLFDNSPLTTSIWDDMNDADRSLNPASTWLAAEYFKTFEDFYHKWEEQPLYDPTDPAYDTYEEQPLYINQLIDLKNKIEDENTGHTVDVMLCLNILSETATKCKTIVEYLQDNGVTLKGIEIGNEVYFGWAKDMLGFDLHGHVTAFIHYWDYINGFNYTSGTTGVDLGDGFGDANGQYNGSDFNLNLVLPADVLADHNYIGVLKSDAETSAVPIGLPGHNLPNCGQFPFVTTEGGGTKNFTTEYCPPCTYPQWNIELASKYTKQITGTSTYKFDAVILHPYYTPTNVQAAYIDDCNSNWYNIPLCLTGATYTTPWTYDTYDEDLRCAFDGILGFPTVDTDLDGIPDQPADGNFRTFVTTRLKQAMDAHKSYLKISTADTGPEVKSIWYTEYNINTDDNIDPAEDDYINTILNTFAHSEGLWNWILWNIKSNAGVSYRANYFTSATLQTFLSGSSIGLMTNLDQDEEALNELYEISAISPCDGSLVDCTSDKDCLNNDYYMRRITYYAMQLLSKINYDHLIYLKSTAIALVGGPVNYNIPPTVFYNGNTADPKLYVFYSNVKDEEQTFGFDPGLVYQLFPLATSVNLYGGTINFLNAEMPYNTSGKSSLYRINTWYNCFDGGGSQMHTIEIDEDDVFNGLADTDCPTGGSGAACVVVPPYSLGYFTLDIDVNYRLGEVQDIYSIFPNPASTGFSIQQLNPDNSDITEMLVEVYNSYGSLVQTSKVIEGQTIDISKLPVGSYNILIKTDGLLPETETLIKMK